MVGVLGLTTGCGAHFHRPQDAEVSQGAEGDLQAAHLTDGFTPELAQAQTMLTQELEVARAWAQQGRDRDLLDVLAATADDERDPDTEALLHLRCRGRFAGDGWATLCNKLARRIADLGGLEVPAATPVPKPVPAARGRANLPAAAPPGPDAIDTLLIELRRQARVWHGPQSHAARLARVGTDAVARQARVETIAAAGMTTPRCPGPPASTVGAGHAAGAELAQYESLCRERRDHVAALPAAVCGNATNCTGGLIGTQAALILAVHDALAGYHNELARRMDVYKQVRRTCGQLGPGPGNAAPTPTTTGTCDRDQLARAFAGLVEIPTPQVLTARGLGVLAQEGRVIQLGEQIAALDTLIETREVQASRRAGPNQVAGITTTVPRAVAEALHTTIAGIDRVAEVTDAFEMAVLVLVRETLRVEMSSLQTAVAHAERRRRIDLAKLSGQLQEYNDLITAYAQLGRLERSGCTSKGIVPTQALLTCRDPTTQMLVAYGNAWTLGRTAQQQADVLDLGVRHEASIDRSRAAMAVREVYLAAGVTELTRFTRGGLHPEALAQIIVSAVGFAVVAGGVY